MLWKKNEAGYALMGVLVVFTITAIVGVALVSTTVGSVKTSDSESKSQAIYYIAEASVNNEFYEIKKAAQEVFDDVKEMERDDFLENGEDPEEVSDHKIQKRMEKKFYDDLTESLEKVAERYDDYESVDGIQPETDVDVEALDEKGKFKIIATGWIEEDEIQTVDKDITIKWVTPGEGGSGGKGGVDKAGRLPFAVFTSNDFVMNNGHIVGDIGTINEERGGLSFPGGGPSHDGEIFVPGGEESGIVSNKATWGIKSEIEAIDSTYRMPVLPEFPTIPEGYTRLPDKKIAGGGGPEYLEMNQNLEFGTIEIGANKELIIDVGNKDKELVLNKLNLVQGHIKIIGTGSLTIYVREEISPETGSSTINNNGNIDQVNIFYSGKRDFKVGGDQAYYASLYAKDANVHLGAGGNVYGNIFTGGDKVFFDGGSSAHAQLIFAPYAEASFAGGGSLLGSIYSESFNNTGGGNVNFPDCGKDECDKLIKNGPISAEALGLTSGDDDGGSTKPDISHTPTKGVN